MNLIFIMALCMPYYVYTLIINLTSRDTTFSKPETLVTYCKLISFSFFLWNAQTYLSTYLSRNEIYHLSSKLETHFRISRLPSLRLGKPIPNWRSHFRVLSSHLIVLKYSEPILISNEEDSSSWKFGNYLDPGLTNLDTITYVSKMRYLEYHPFV